MIAKDKTLIADDQGKPMRAIIPWAEFLEISELLDLEPDASTGHEFEPAQTDIASGNHDTYPDSDGGGQGHSASLSTTSPQQGNPLKPDGN